MWFSCKCLIQLISLATQIQIQIIQNQFLVTHFSAHTLFLCFFRLFHLCFALLWLIMWQQHFCSGFQGWTLTAALFFFNSKFWSRPAGNCWWSSPQNLHDVILLSACVAPHLLFLSFCFVFPWQPRLPASFLVFCWGVFLGLAASENVTLPLIFLPFSRNWPCLTHRSVHI